MAINSNSLSGTRQVLIFPLFDYTSDAQIKLPTACKRGRRLGALAAGELRVPAVRLLFRTITELIRQPASKQILDAHDIKTLSDANDAALFDQFGRLIILLIAGICAPRQTFSIFSHYSWAIQSITYFNLRFKFEPLQLSRAAAESHLLSIQFLRAFTSCLPSKQTNPFSPF